MNKRPISRFSEKSLSAYGCGDVLSEINENVDIVNNASGGTTPITPATPFTVEIGQTIATITILVSIGYDNLSNNLGNPGKYCTATVECQNNCN